MNPPSAIHSAMGRERKPFTYTPGGLDLSEIKSERMAKRLMRNAMNQGVPELPPQGLQPPQSPSTPIAVPNFNCLPVQVFPAFNLPANPKSLLRTRSTPEQPRDHHSPKVTPQNFQTNNIKCKDVPRDTVNNNTPAYSYINNNSCNNSRPPVTLEINSLRNTSLNSTQCGSDIYTPPILPEICYEAEYLNAAPTNHCDRKVLNSSMNSDIVVKPTSSEITKPSGSNSNLDTNDNLTNTAAAMPSIIIKPLTETISMPTDKLEDSSGTSDDQKEVKVVKNQSKRESKVEVENQNGKHNGDAETETEMTIKLPLKKSEAKTETKVEVTKKQLPDGSTEEVKVTTTRTTKDGRTEIKTRTETTIIPKEVETEEEEEEEEIEEEVVEENDKKETSAVAVQESSQVPKETSQIVTKQETSESTTTKKVVVVQEQEKDEEEEEQEEEEEEEEEVEEPVKETRPQPPAQKPKPPPTEEPEEEEEQVVKKEQQEEEDEEEIEEEEIEEEVKVTKGIINVAPEAKNNKEEVEEEEEEEPEEVEDKIQSKPEVPSAEPQKVQQTEDDEESEYTEEEIEDDEPPKPAESEEKPENAEPIKEKPQSEEQPKAEPTQEEKKELSEPPSEPKVPFREPSIPLEKVEDVEIKPIGLITKSHTESTEITRNTTEKPAGILSTQTEFNRIENIVTVNRTTKTLDNTYEQMTQQGIPTVKTYFAPDRERVSTSPLPSKPYQPAYTPQQHSQPERRHSLLLERLSTERQMPSDIYQSTIQNQNYEQQRQWSQEPQSEVINVSNVKPSQITNQQWYQQSRKENVIYNNTDSATPSSAPQQQQWAQPQSQPQQWSQPQTQQWTQPQPEPQPQHQTSYTENISHDTSRTTSNIYQNQNNNYPSYTPNTNWTPVNNLGTPLSSANNQSNQYSTYLNKDSESYQKSSQEYSSSYVPPPWEQDSRYVTAEIPTQAHTPSYYQSAPPSNNFSPSSKPSWKPAPGKFSKPPPTAYIPPAPNQSFVKTGVDEPPKLPGRKTYYSEYERRYISVPESTYIPKETKLQPDPTPQYYYDNNEPSETVEHQWRKELREFTEKTSQTQHHTSGETSVRPPWEEDPKYVKAPPAQTQTWSQTLRPQSWRERSFESEYVGSKEWNKTNTMGRGRPLSSYGGSNLEQSIPERTRGVSVDRYNPNNYQSPVLTEHSPVPTHTHNPPITPHSKGYHNPNVPAYHARTSAEPRDQPTVIPQPRQAWGDSRTTPIQSRSFKYLQWITGTED